MFGGQADLPIGDVGLDEAEHGDGGLVHADEDAVVDLAETEELKDLADLRGDADDTTDADNNGKLTLRLQEVVSLLLGLTALIDQVLLDGGVLLVVLLGVLESGRTSGLGSLSCTRAGQVHAIAPRLDANIGLECR